MVIEYDRVCEVPPGTSCSKNIMNGGVITTVEARQNDRVAFVLDYEVVL